MNKLKHAHNKSVTIKQEDVEDEINIKYEGLQDEDSPNKGAMQLYDVNIQYKKKLEGGL